MKKLVKDSNIFNESLNDLGWKDSNFKDYQDQRNYLKKNNGIKDLKILHPKEIEEAKRIEAVSILNNNSLAVFKKTTVEISLSLSFNVKYI